MSATENIFLKQLNRQPAQASPEGAQTPPSNNMFLKQLEGREIPEAPEGFLKSSARTSAQLPLAFLQRYTWPADVLKFLGGLQGKENLAELKELYPDFDEAAFEKAQQEGGKYFPTQGAAEQLIEEKTGLPLTPKTKIQKLARIGGTAATFRPGSLAQKATAGIAAPTVTAGLEAAGVPEGVAEVGGLLAGGLAPVPSVSKAVKPSGMTARRFEDVKKPVKVSGARQEAIKESVEGDFKKIADQIMEKKSKTYSAMKEDSLFKEKIGDLFGEVEQLAKEIPGNIHTDDLRKAFKKRFNSRETKGITPDEFERSFRKEVRQVLKDIPFDQMTAPQLVEQFRKNNKSLRELFEPGKSAASNRAKKEALLEYNRAIEDVITKKYPDSEFKKMFEFSNKRWSELSDIEQIDKFSQDLFNGKINYSKAKQLFSRDKEHVQRPFKRILGEDGFKEFQTLTEDLLSTEKSMGYIKKAHDAGFDDLAKTASLYLISKKAGAISTMTKAAKTLYQATLDKPKIAVTWNKAIKNLKDGNYKEAQKYFTLLDSEVKSENPTSKPK